MKNNVKKNKDGSNQSEKKENRSGKYKVHENVNYILSAAWKNDKIIFLFFIIYTVLTAVSPFLGIFYPKFILDELTAEQNKEHLIRLLLGFFISSAAVGYGITFFKSAYYPRMIAVRLKFILRLSNKCLTTDFKNTEDPEFLNSVETSFRALENDDGGVEGILHRLFSLGGSMVVLTGYIFIIGNLNFWILIYLIISIGITYLLTLSVKRYEYNKADELSGIDRHGEYAYRLMYDFAYGKDMRIYGLRDWIGSLFQKFKQERYVIDKTIQYKYFKTGLFEVIFLVIREGLVYVYLINQVIHHGLGIGSFTMYFAAVASFADVMKKIVEDLAHIRAQSLYVDDYRNFLRREEEREVPHPEKLPKGPYEIEFKNVSFKYPGSEKYVYENVSFKIPAGQKLAIVGHNGAGKTTFVKLLCRMYEPESGEILLNGINIRNFSKGEYYTLFSAVFQEVKTTAFSVAENIAVSEEVKEPWVLDCLEKADMKEKVLRQKKGIHTGMQKILDDEGIEFSGGETQRIILARALYKDGGIVILDEPTAALDALAEKSIYESFNDMVREKTAVFISHRLASTSFCDKIALFEQGKLVEYGTHQELLSAGGKYAAMFQVQAQYYQEKEKEETCQENSKEDRLQLN